jgi:hypothetical protein
LLLVSNQRIGPSKFHLKGFVPLHGPLHKNKRGPVRNRVFNISSHKAY